MPRNLRFTRILARTQSVVRDLGSMHFSQYHPESSTWAPPVNVYRYEDRFEVCVDLAGVPKDQVEVQAESKRLRIAGIRPSPAPECGEPDSPCRQTLALEIENGPFEREIQFPLAIDTSLVRARQENGLLWITLPFQTPTSL